MNQYSDSIVGVWIIFLVFLVLGGIVAFWWFMKNRTHKIKSIAPSNDGEAHEEFVTKGASEAPPDPRVTGKRA